MFTMDDYFRATGIEQLKFDVMCEQVGHEPISTFWQDFTIAESFGESAIRDTYRKAVDEWGEDVEYMAELTLVLNCEECPANREFSSWPGYRYPCGQFICEIYMNTRSEEER